MSNICSDISRYLSRCLVCKTQHYIIYHRESLSSIPVLFHIFIVYYVDDILNCLSPSYTNNLPVILYLAVGVIFNVSMCSVARLFMYQVRCLLFPNYMDLSPKHLLSNKTIFPEILLSKFIHLSVCPSIHPSMPSFH